MNEDPTAWKSWIGRALTVEDEIGPRRAQALQATLDIQGRALQAGDPLPPLWHWLYFWDLAPASTLGPNGHPERGEFLPPIELPRRMWAGVRELISPSILAVATLLTIFAVILMSVLEVLRRRNARLRGVEP